MITTWTGSLESVALVLPGVCTKPARPTPTTTAQASRNLLSETRARLFFFFALGPAPPAARQRDSPAPAAASIPRLSSFAGIASPSLLQPACLCVLFPSYSLVLRPGTFPRHPTYKEPQGASAALTYCEPRARTCSYDFSDLNLDEHPRLPRPAQQLKQPRRPRAPTVIRCVPAA